MVTCTASARRALERECHRNVEVIWLLRKLAPDFKTIADFRRDHRASFKLVHRQFHLLCHLPLGLHWLNQRRFQR